MLVSTDNPGSPNLQAGLAKLPIYVVGGGAVGLGQRFNRFDLSIKGDFERTIYQQSTLTDGSTSSNDDRNYDQYSGLLRGGYELSPGLTPFAEVAVDTRVHDLNTDFSGYQRNSNGVTGKAGAKFELTRLITGEAALGYTQRVYEDPRLANISAPVGNASLLWTVDALTNVKLIAASTIGESTVPGVSGVLYRDAGVQVDHSFRRWLIGSLKFGFGVDDYVGLDRIDKRYLVGAGLTYKLNRSVQVKGEFRQNWLTSNVAGVDYTESVFHVGTAATTLFISRRACRRSRSQLRSNIGALQAIGEIGSEKANLGAAVKTAAFELKAIKWLRSRQRQHCIGELNFAACAGSLFFQQLKNLRLQDVSAGDAEIGWSFARLWLLDHFCDRKCLTLCGPDANDAVHMHAVLRDFLDGDDVGVGIQIFGGINHLRKATTLSVAPARPAKAEQRAHGRQVRARTRLHARDRAVTVAV